MHTSGDDFALIVFWSANRLIAFKCPTWCASVMRTFGAMNMRRLCGARVGQIWQECGGQKQPIG